MIEIQTGIDQNLEILIGTEVNLDQANKYNTGTVGKQVSETFCNKGQKCENGSNLPLGSLEVFVYGESSPKFTMYKKRKANGALTRENQNVNNKSAKKV